jgi:hypothetical protein
LHITNHREYPTVVRTSTAEFDIGYVALSFERLFLNVILRR